jgi:hypothetical protein
MLPRMTALGKLLACMAVAGLTAGCSSSTAPAAKTFTLKATVRLSHGVALKMGALPCIAGSPGDSDVTAGAQVTVYDDAGKVLGVGALESGLFPVEMLQGPCDFPFTVTGVPMGGKFYQVGVAGHARMTLTAEDAESGSAALTIE